MGGRGALLARHDLKVRNTAGRSWGYFLKQECWNVASPHEGTRLVQLHDTYKPDDSDNSAHLGANSGTPCIARRSIQTNVQI